MCNVHVSFFIAFQTCLAKSVVRPTTNLKVSQYKETKQSEYKSSRRVQTPAKANAVRIRSRAKSGKKESAGIEHGLPFSPHALPLSFFPFIYLPSLSLFPSFPVVSISYPGDSSDPARECGSAVSSDSRSGRSPAGRQTVSGLF